MDKKIARIEEITEGNISLDSLSATRKKVPN